MPLLCGAPTVPSVLSVPFVPFVPFPFVPFSFVPFPFVPFMPLPFELFVFSEGSVLPETPLLFSRSLRLLVLGISSEAASV